MEKKLSFEEFTASPKVLTDIDELFEYAISSGIYDICDTTAGTFQDLQFLIYPNDFVIEFSSVNDKYYLRLENHEYASHELSDMEEVLYDYYGYDFINTITSLTEEYQGYLKRQALPALSADEHPAETLTLLQLDHMKEFIDRWDVAAERKGL
jgi:hypothetical protein